MAHYFCSAAARIGINFAEKDACETVLSGKC